MNSKILVTDLNKRHFQHLISSISSNRIEPITLVQIANAITVYKGLKSRTTFIASW